MTVFTIETNGTVRDLAEAVTLGSNYTSDPIDFTHSTVGSIHFTWTGNDKADGEVYLESSLLDDGDWFDEVLGSAVTMNAAGSTRGNKKTVLWSHESLGFRLIRVVYLKGTNTTGTFSIKTSGKSGGRW